MSSSRSTRTVSSLWVAPLLAAGALVAATPGCYDFTPITSIPATPLPDSGIVITPSGEGGADGGEGGTVSSPCADCAEASCADRLKTCRDTPKCEAFYQCGVALKCYSPEADKLSCFTQCAGVAGMSGYEDPAVPPALGLDGCMTESCPAACK